MKTIAGLRAPRLGPGRVVGLAIVVLLATAWFLWLRPPWLGGPLTIIRVTGQSMEPGMHTGDLALMHAGSAYNVGDVVAFRIPSPDGPGPFVIHRIVAEDDGVLKMRGDNNIGNDPWNITESDIAGKLWVHIPGAGQSMAYLADPVVLAALAASATAFVVVLGDTPARSRRRSPEPSRKPQQMASR